ncbi:MAG TPA: tRNA (guanosine(37)-N1)-methyltransferase TrmD [Firmicutes bacterium]|nr:tRNA (guanosine(37)-N1)-methyltransferase TrmD [Candidatus Fermentithermobacillaceae bacterium]
MNVYILTLFPQMFSGVLGASILGRAIERGVIRVKLVDIRAFAHDAHKTTDDYPYGGGPGMVMKPEPVYEAVDAVKEEIAGSGSRDAPYVCLLTPQGETFCDRMARDLAGFSNLVLICGHYEGFDERVRYLADREISIGDYVLTGGEIPAMVVLDAVVRYVPGVLGSEESPRSESFAEGLLEGPQYTRPAEYRGLKVPEILLSGDHEKIRRWRRKQSLKRTLERRPDLLDKAALTPEDRELLLEIAWEADAGDDSGTNASGTDAQRGAKW